MSQVTITLHSPEEWEAYNTANHTLLGIMNRQAERIAQLESTHAPAMLAEGRDGGKLPERMEPPENGYSNGGLTDASTADAARQWDNGWNACLDQIAIAAQPVSPEVVEALAKLDEYANGDEYQRPTEIICTALRNFIGKAGQ